MSFAFDSYEGFPVPGLHNDIMGLARAMANPKAARPCAHCEALDELDHEDHCPAERRRREVKDLYGLEFVSTGHVSVSIIGSKDAPAMHARVPGLFACLKTPLGARTELTLDEARSVRAALDQAITTIEEHVS